MIVLKFQLSVLLVENSTVLEQRLSTTEKVYPSIMMLRSRKIRKIIIFKGNKENLSKR